MTGPEDTIHYAMGYEDTEEMTEGQLSEYLAENFDDGGFDDFDCDE